MDVSIIIVNYNVRFFLEQTLHSVYKSIKLLKVEIFVVDNASIDHSVDMLKSTFPDVKLITNTKNVGFSKANNQAIALSSGKYILLLNPDTVLQDDTLESCYQFMENHPNAGGLGVQMVDGKGVFLPESKRGIPTPLVALYKLTGLSGLFPKSKVFGRYHLGFLDKDQTHEVEVLSGAFMWLRKNVLDEIGYLDESYFMYGEDIDLSYRILKSGYKNYYFSGTRIIHYKGESTKKSSYKYVVTFYTAMIIFARKHFSGIYGNFLIQLIRLAIVGRASVSYVHRIYKNYGIYIVHFLLILTGLESIRFSWESLVKDSTTYYPSVFTFVFLPIYALAWILSIYFSGGYDKPVSTYRIIRGVLFGTLIISAITNFLDPFRFSKAIIVLGAFWTLSSVLLHRYVMVFLSKRSIFSYAGKEHQILVIGSEQEFMRLKSLLSHWQMSIKIIGFVDADGSTSIHPDYLGNLGNMRLILQIYTPDEIIFCDRDFSTETIIHWMHFIHTNSKAEFKILPEKGDFIIGSGNKDTQGDLYAVDVEFQLLKKQSKRNKRLIDILLSSIILMLVPFIYRRLKRINIGPKALLQVLSGQKTLVGIQLPQMEKQIGLIAPYAPYPMVDEPTKYRIQWMYAKNYHPSMDIDITLKTVFYEKEM